MVDEFKRAKQVKYLGTIVTEKNETDKEIAARIVSGNKCFYGLSKILGSRSLSFEMKKELYTTLIRPVIIYGAETWTLRKNEEKKLQVFERKILRKIFGPVKDSETGEWRVRKNNELESLFKKENIVNTIRNRRLQWAGHVMRNQNNIIRMTMDENPIGKRPLGRPRMRWEDMIKKDVEALNGGPDWRVRALDREGWKIGCVTGWS